jgi:hypothetical protein
MTMSEENKYNSFFQDSPIPVPPTEEAWSLMQQKLNVQMPVGVGGAGGFGRVFRLRVYRCGIPAATVAVVTVGVWLGLHKEGHRHSGRPSVQVVSRGAAAKPMDSGNLTDRSRGMKSGQSADSVAQGEGTDRDRTATMKTSEAIVKTGGSVKETSGAVVKIDGSVKKTGGTVAKTDGSVARTAGTKNPGRMDMTGMPKDGLAGTSNRKGGKSGKNGRIGKGGHRAGNGEGNSQRELAEDQSGLAGSQGGLAGNQRDLTGNQRDLAGHQKQSAGTASASSREALEEWRRRQRDGKAALLLPVRTGSGYAGSFPDNLASLLASGRGVVKGPLAGKGQYTGKGPGANSNASAKTRKGAAHKGGLILAAGLGDGQNFPVGGQQAIAINSAGGSGKLTDHLPWAYARLYMGDRIYLQAGLHLYSPQYTRPQQIDSTGDSSRLVGYQGLMQDTIVTVNKLYYTDIPLTVYYRVAGRFYLGAGLQYSRLWGGNTTRRVVLHPTNGVDSTLILNTNLAIDLKNEPGASAHLNKSDWRILLDAAWSWKRLTLALRYQQALSSYTREGEGVSKARNTALSLYASYDIWRRRLKQ